MTYTQSLSEKSIKILGMLAEGHSFSHIVDSCAEIRYPDIFDAAKETLILNKLWSDHEKRITEVKSIYPKAYDLWAPEDDTALEAMHCQGKSIPDMATGLQRHPTAIKSRLKLFEVKVRKEPLKARAQAAIASADRRGAVGNNWRVPTSL